MIKKLRERAVQSFSVQGFEVVLTSPHLACGAQATFSYNPNRSMGDIDVEGITVLAS